MNDNNYFAGVPLAAPFIGTPGLRGVLGDDMYESKYFFSLPEDVQEEINGHADEIHSVEDLHRAAEDLLRRE